MGFGETVVLGAIAGFTIYLGLPAGRVKRLDQRVRVALAMFSVGILAFIFVDVTAHAQSIVEGALTDFKDHRASFGHVAGLFALLAVQVVLGLVRRGVHLLVVTGELLLHRVGSLVNRGVGFVRVFAGPFLDLVNNVAKLHQYLPRRVRCRGYEFPVYLALEPPDGVIKPTAAARSTGNYS